MQKCIKTGILTILRPRPFPPPIVDQYIERVERFDVMPPKRRDVDCVPGTQVRHLSRPEGFSKPRKLLEVRRSQRHEAHGCAGRREVERTNVEIGDLVRRKEGESAAP